MEKSEIIKIFINKGHQLDSESLNYFLENPDRLKTFLEGIPKEGKLPFNINKQMILKLTEKEYKPDFEIIKVSKYREKFSVQDMLTFVNKRYGEIKKMLSKRMDLINLISINKISDKSKKFSIIVITREVNKSQNQLTVEDNTGRIDLKLSDKLRKNIGSIYEDEVLGFICEKENGNLMVTGIIFPEIPLRKEINRTDKTINCLFISDLKLDQTNTELKDKLIENIKKIGDGTLFIFLLGNISSDKETVNKFNSELPQMSKKFLILGEIDKSGPYDNVQVLQDPTWMKIGNVVIFLSHGSFLSSYLKESGDKVDDVLINLLKKRNFNPKFENMKKISEEDPYFLDIVPDVVALGHFQEPTVRNYKGTTIITNGGFSEKPIFWNINLQSREIIKIDLL